MEDTPLNKFETDKQLEYLRLLYDMDFVQLLANPSYLNCILIRPCSERIFQRSKFSQLSKIP